MTKRDVLIVIIAGAVILRLALWAVAYLHVGESNFIRGDTIGYWQLAQNLAGGNGFVITDAAGVVYEETFRTPGFPLLLTPFTVVENGLSLYMLFAAIVSGVLMPLLTFLIGRRIAGYRIGLLSAALVAIEPHQIYFSVMPLSEGPFMLCALGGFVAALYAYDRRSLLFSVLSGALFGYAVFIRPGFLHVALALIVATFAYLWWKRDGNKRIIAVIPLILLLTIAPWCIRNNTLTGSFSLSGQGLSNVYMYYLASVRAIDNGTSFSEERNTLKNEALPRFGISRQELGDPSNSSVLGVAALREMWERRFTVLKLETSLLVSFFLNDSYFYHFRQMGLVSDVGPAHESPTQAILTHGLGGIPTVMKELARQKFIPLWGRLWVLTVLLSAVAGFFMTRSQLRYILAGAIVLTALISTAIGFGVEARLRIPMEPFLFIFTAVAWYAAYDYIQSKRRV